MGKIISKKPIIGFVRYSQKLKFGNHTDERNVFEPEYFEYRLNIFKFITLKSFQQQTNPNFLLLLLHSENMPSAYKERFIELERENVFLYNLFMEDTLESFNETLSNSIDYISFENNTAITFRIDNDDAVQIDFVEKLYTYLKYDFAGLLLNFPLMNIIKRTSRNLYMLQESYYPANAIGLANITERHGYKTIFEFGDHDLVNNEHTLIMLSKNSGGSLQTINGENEVNSIENAKSIILNREDLDNYLAIRKLGNLDLDCLRIYNEEDKFSDFSARQKIKFFLPRKILRAFRNVRAFFIR